MLVVRIIVYVECIIISHECDIGFSYLLLYIIRFLLIRQQSVCTVQEQPSLHTPGRWILLREISEELFKCCSIQCSKKAESMQGWNC